MIVNVRTGNGLSTYNIDNIHESTLLEILDEWENDEK